MPTIDNLPVLPFATQSQFETWLRENHVTYDGVWIKIAKKASGIPSISQDEVLDVALCYGWIDSLRRGLDDTYFLQRCTPRRKGSAWSARNIAKVTKLILTEKMQPSGLREVEAAKHDGRWHHHN